MSDRDPIISAEDVAGHAGDIPGQLDHISQTPVGEIWHELPKSNDGLGGRVVGLGQVLGIFQSGAAFGYRFAQLEALRQPPETGPDVIVGRPLAGHIPWNVIADQENGDEKYWAQVIPSEFGDLYYALEQYRDGTEQWITNHGEVQVIVHGGPDEPATVRNVQMRPAHKWEDAAIYVIGLKEYRETHPEA